MRLSVHSREIRTKIVRNYQGSAVGFRVDRIRLPNGRRSQREFLTHPGAVGVLAFESPRRLLLIKQFRYPVGRFTYEIPAGKLSAAENPMSCVRRELEEEAGVRARRVRKLLSFWPTPAFSNETLHLYIATDLIPTQANPDEDEFLEIVRVSPKTMEGMIRRGRIRDAKTVIAYLAWKNLIARRRR